MQKLRYLKNRFVSMDMNRLKEAVKKVHTISGKNSFFVMLDIFYCGWKYQAGYNDYLSFGFYQLKRKDRKTYLTRGKNNQLVARYNQKDAMSLFDEKDTFNHLYQDFIKRDWLYLDENEKEFELFMKSKDVIIIKPNNDQGGHGVEKIYKKDFVTMYQLYETLMLKKTRLVEEVIVQHPDLAALYDGSVNTIRVITLRIKDQVHFITAFLRIGNGGVVDNTCSGGMLTMIDIETGVTLYPACDIDLNVYEKHPVTQHEIKGIQIPHWEDLKNTVIKMALKTDEMHYIGWDMAVLEDGVDVVEANPYPGYYYQFPLFCPDKKGIYAKFEELERLC